jgi:hypothetical protein
VLDPSEWLFAQYLQDSDIFKGPHPQVPSLLLLHLPNLDIFTLLQRLYVFVHIFEYFNGFGTLSIILRKVLPFPKSDTNAHAILQKC